MVVVLGDTEMLFPDNPPGSHVQVKLPVTLKVDELPMQIDAGDAVGASDGNGLEVIVIVDFPIHPVVLFVPDTV